MVEFGEKIKQLREEKGMTQQTLAEKLYVTRQAVSRWECGARYPELLTAKKIAHILGVSVDELLSGEELGKNVEREPVLARPVENIVQTVLYTVAVIAYMLMCIFSLYSILFPNESLANTPAGEISWITISSIAAYILNFVAVLIGLYFSVRNRLTARLTGYIMSLPYLIACMSFLFTYIDMQIRNNGYMSIEGWMTDFLFPFLITICVFAYFISKDRRIPYPVILAICILTLYYIASVYKNHFVRFTDLGFVVTTVHCMGKIGMVFLLGYQGYVWDQKKKVSVRVSSEN